ncbi:MAG: GNAT family N-acetyltransferase [Acidobacteria bacterium]|nr:GNAT family N-acetyltransferase [Acidobacteriota bacterium]
MSDISIVLASAIRLTVPLAFAGAGEYVAERGGAVAGYAYATRWKPRRGYRFSAEVTVYVAPEHAGTGVGSALYTQLLPTLQEKGIHAVIGGIALPNAASARLHEKFGFRKVAHFEQTGYKFDQWIDVGYWELIL